MLNKQLSDDLISNGYAIIPQLINKKSCKSLRSLYEEPANFRKKVIMQRHRFGKGEYQYFADPIPTEIAKIRTEFYSILQPTANSWMMALKLNSRFPLTLGKFLNECQEHNQNLPTPLLLKYSANDYNCLHKDLYGEIFFPFQMMICLSQKEEEFTGGEFLLMEQKYMSQPSCEVISPNQGDAVIFSTQYRPVRGTRGYYRANLKHGVARIQSGTRYSLGIIFHNAVS